jgi:hypothetical protein
LFGFESVRCVPVAFPQGNALEFRPRRRACWPATSILGILNGFNLWTALWKRPQESLLSHWHVFNCFHHLHTVRTEACSTWSHSEGRTGSTILTWELWMWNTVWKMFEISRIFGNIFANTLKQFLKHLKTDETGSLHPVLCTLKWTRRRFQGQSQSCLYSVFSVIL